MYFGWKKYYVVMCRIYIRFVGYHIFPQNRLFAKFKGGNSLHSRQHTACDLVLLLR